MCTVYNSKKSANAICTGSSAFYESGDRFSSSPGDWHGTAGGRAFEETAERYETGDFDRSLPKRDHDPGISHCGLYHDGIFSWIIWMAGMYGGKCDWFQCCSGDYGIFYLNIGPLIPWIYLPQSPESFQNRHFQ